MAWTRGAARPYLPVPACKVLRAFAESQAAPGGRPTIPAEGYITMDRGIHDETAAGAEL